MARYKLGDKLGFVPGGQWQAFIKNDGPTLPGGWWVQFRDRQLVGLISGGPESRIDRQYQSDFWLTTASKNLVETLCSGIDKLAGHKPSIEDTRFTMTEGKWVRLGKHSRYVVHLDKKGCIDGGDRVADFNDVNEWVARNSPVEECQRDYLKKLQTHMMDFDIKALLVAGVAPFAHGQKMPNGWYKLNLTPEEKEKFGLGPDTGLWFHSKDGLITSLLSCSNAGPVATLPDDLTFMNGWLDLLGGEDAVCGKLKQQRLQPWAMLADGWYAITSKAAHTLHVYVQSGVVTGGCQTELGKPVDASASKILRRPLMDQKYEEALEKILAEKTALPGVKTGWYEIPGYDMSVYVLDGHIHAFGRGHTAAPDKTGVTIQAWDRIAVEQIGRFGSIEAAKEILMKNASIQAQLNATKTASKPVSAPEKSTMSYPTLADGWHCLGQHPNYPGPNYWARLVKGEVVASYFVDQGHSPESHPEKFRLGEKFTPHLTSRNYKPDELLAKLVDRQTLVSGVPNGYYNLPMGNYVFKGEIFDVQHSIIHVYVENEHIVCVAGAPISEVDPDQIPEEQDRNFLTNRWVSSVPGGMEAIVKLFQQERERKDAEREMTVELPAETNSSVGLGTAAGAAALLVFGSALLKRAAQSRRQEKQREQECQVK